jgi:hypothetical protein
MKYGLMILLICLSRPAPAAIHHVPAEFGTIQAALDSSSSGDTVLVASGIYSGGGNQDLHFRGRDIVLLSERGAELTTIDVRYEIDNRGIWFDEHETRDAVVDGFTIRNGDARGGGGILCTGDAAPTIRRCILTDNLVWDYYAGMAICCREQAAPLIEECTIQGNRGLGGAVAFLDESSPTITRSVLRDNLDTAIICRDASSPRIENCIIFNNSGSSGAAGMDAGGILITSSATVTVASSTIVWNWAAAMGSGGIDARGSGIVIVTGCTIRANAGGGWGPQGCGGIRAGGSAMSLERTLIRGNCVFPGVPGDIAVTSGVMRAGCCALDTSAVFTQAGAELTFLDTQVFGDPLFCVPHVCMGQDEGSWDSTLGVQSPCLPERSPCGELIGAWGEGCSGPSAVRVTSWGAIKSSYR